VFRSAVVGSKSFISHFIPSSLSVHPFGEIEMLCSFVSENIVYAAVMELTSHRKDCAFPIPSLASSP
jgi:hypothetical protein